jgi:hypothetical protein
VGRWLAAGIVGTVGILAWGVMIPVTASADSSPVTAPGGGAGHQVSRSPAPVVPFRPSSTSALTEFQGLGPSETYGGTTSFWTPGEPVVAVGPSDILQTANEAAAVFNKSGTKLAEFDFGTFWGGTLANPTDCTDPRALYIASVDRFAMSCSATSIHFAVSATGDPTGIWHKYVAPNASFLDQDKIEATSDKFVVAGNTSSTEQMYVYNLADLVTGVAKPPVASKVAKKSNIYEAAVQQTSTSNAYFVSSFPGNLLYLAKITGTPAAKDVALTETLVKSTDFAAPFEPSVPGGNIGGGELDGRVYDAVYEAETSDGKPVIQYSSARQCGTRDCITSARIDLSGAVPVLRYDQLIGEPGFDFSYGAAGLDGAGNVFEVYTRTTPGSAPAAAVVGPGFMATIQAPGPGTTSCGSGTCDERWGDYFGTAVDPSDPTSVWVTATYQATSGTFGWGTVIAKVSTVSLALPTVTTGTPTHVTVSGAKLGGTVNPNGAATTYHIDYGLTTGYDAASPEVSAGSGTSPVAVTATVSGLTEATLYHYRVVATTATGSAVGPDKTFRTAGPKITAVAFTGSPASPTVTITGTLLGSEPAGTPAGCGATGQTFGNSLWIDDVSGSWAGGQAGDCIGLAVASYAPTQIVYSFGSFYATSGLPPLDAGDSYAVTVAGVTFTGTVAYT